MSNFYIEATGFEELIAKVELLANEELKKTNKEVVTEAGKLVQTKAEELAPISQDHMSSGKWSKSGKFRMTPPNHMKMAIPLKIKGGNKAQALIGWENNSSNDNSFYAKFVEYGTSKMPPRPFLQTALDSSESEINSIAETKFTELIEKTLN